MKAIYRNHLLLQVELVSSGLAREFGRELMREYLYDYLGGDIKSCIYPFLLQDITW